jgi:hypothetical protein
MKTIIITTLILLSFTGAKTLKKDIYPQHLDNAVFDQGSVQGKYVNLLHTINVPEDKATYGGFCDWGYWYGDEYDHHVNLSPGFWVYVYPNWFIWEKLSAEETITPGANAYGKYTLLMHVLHVPDDAKTYSAYYDWGFSEEYSYAGYENLIPGYWVYVEPNWYVWGDVTHNDGGT